MLPRRAKIVCTIGPASSSPEKLAALVEAGMDVARLNFSHGAHQDHAQVIGELRRLAARAGRPLAVLQDLQGPKIRTGPLAAGPVELRAGSPFTITTRPVPGDDACVSTTYQHLPADVKPGDQILLSDGLLRLEVRAVRGEEVECRVVDGGQLRARAGINLPGVQVSAPSLTEKDEEDLEFGIAQEVDYVALSFVRRAADVIELKERLARRGAPTGVVPKIEKPQALDELEAILLVADAVMIARGDLGVELSPERVPFIQKQIIRQAAQLKVPVITATQMLESMIEHPRPTRAEASDVANAIFDGTDAVMLSGETAAGRYPVEAAAMMARIVREAETHLTFTPERRRREEGTVSFPDAMAEAACRAAAEVKAVAIVAFTQSGFTARLISKHRPTVPVIAFTPHERICRRLGLYWGVLPRYSPFIADTEQMIARADAALLQEGLTQPGDPLVFLAGSPPHQQGTTNLLKLHRAGLG
ncbi:MAG: pyruvate kinase [Candidatus Latescibacteria bacterium]|nr:pyruvate kinase [Candidatus Latescibacterota bacterium]